MPGVVAAPGVPVVPDGTYVVVGGVVVAAAGAPVPPAVTCAAALCALADAGEPVAAEATAAHPPRAATSAVRISARTTANANRAGRRRRPAGR